MSEALSVVGEGAIFYGRRPQELLEDTTPRRLAINEASPYKFAYARTALKYGLKSIGCRQGDVLLIPDLICESVLEPLKALGIDARYYPVGYTLEPEWPRLEQLLTTSTIALLVVHYFGHPQPIPACLDFCRKHSLFLIEDNTHGFGGTFDSQLLGTFGELGISAPRKSFPIKHGAYLYLANKRVLDLSLLPLQPSASSACIHRIKRRLQQITPIATLMKHRRRMIEYRLRVGPPPPYGSQDAFRDPPLCHDYGMDENIDLFLRQQDIKQIAKVRRRIYQLWQEWAITQGLTPVFPGLLSGTIPLVFPAYTKSVPESLKWYERGHRAGVDIHSWPTLPKVIVKSNVSAMRLWERMLCFPVHQDMNLHLLERRLAVL